jgi:hypothetical protein
MERTLLTAACEALPDSCDRRTSDNEPPTAEEDLVLPPPYPRPHHHHRARSTEPVWQRLQGAGAAAMRIEAARRIFSKVWFNEATTEAGRDALGYYHERKDERKNG